MRQRGGGSLPTISSSSVNLLRDVTPIAMPTVRRGRVIVSIARGSIYRRSQPPLPKNNALGLRSR
jgi:hypothetical protein